MLESIGEWLGGLPTAGVWALIVLLVVQLSVQVYALVDLFRRESVSLSKWVWALIIVLGNLLGALAYLALARRPGQVEEAGAAGAGARESTLDALYGDSSEEGDG